MGQTYQKTGLIIEVLCIKIFIRKQVDTMLDSLTEKELSIVDATIKGLYNAKSQTAD